MTVSVGNTGATLHSSHKSGPHGGACCQPRVVTIQSVWDFQTPVSPEWTEQVANVFGPLQTVANDPTVTDIFVLADGRVYADRGHGALLVTGLRVSAEESVSLARALIEFGGRHLDEASPLVDVRVGEGIRVHAALPPVALGGAVVSIRFARHHRRDLDQLDIDWGEGQRNRLLDAVDARQTLLITGATGSGKTTLLAALLSFASPRDRIVAIEDVSELRIDHPHVVQMECRQANLEGAGEVSLDRLVRESLRMRPTRLVVGECRGAELRDLLSALTTGHRGGASTLHAQSLDDVPARLDSLAALAGLSSEQLTRQACTAFDLVVHVHHEPGTPRRLRVGRFVEASGGTLGVVPAE